MGLKPLKIKKKDPKKIFSVFIPVLNSLFLGLQLAPGTSIEKKKIKKLG
jgi:hypothetical protein